MALAWENAFMFLRKNHKRHDGRGVALKNDKAALGYSRDNRGDCKQVCIGLVCTPEGLPLNFEVFPGNGASAGVIGGFSMH